MAFSQSVIRTYLMTELVAIDPEAISCLLNHAQVSQSLGQRRGFFLAQLPKNWFYKLKENLENNNEFNAHKILLFYDNLLRENGIIRDGHSYLEGENWSKNLTLALESPNPPKIAIGKKSTGNIIGIQDIDPLETFQARVSISNPNEEELWSFLRLHLCNSGKVAFVDRHNDLQNGRGGQSKFSKYLRRIIEGVSHSSKCGEIIIYSQFKDRGSLLYQSTEETFRAAAIDALKGLRLPIQGVIFRCCDDRAKTITDLHARQIITNHACFLCTDSIGGGTKSQKISLEMHMKVDELKAIQNRWFENEHGLDIKYEVKIRQSDIGR